MKNIILALLILSVLMACKPTQKAEDVNKGCDCDLDICMSFREPEVTLNGKLVFNHYTVHDKDYQPFVIHLDKRLCVAGDPSAGADDFSLWSFSRAAIIDNRPA